MPARQKFTLCWLMFALWALSKALFQSQYSPGDGTLAQNAELRLCVLAPPPLLIVILHVAAIICHGLRIDAAVVPLVISVHLNAHATALIVLLFRFRLVVWDEIIIILVVRVI
mmetsp:Transcript_258/g.680  ORF Transcript_258/g.680 Transcript_258/m.680 type:complete len:113 (+) Transcript_258:214-552(+)